MPRLAPLLLASCLLCGVASAQESRPAPKPDAAQLEARDRAFAEIEELLEDIRRTPPHRRRRLMMDLMNDTSRFLDTFAKVATAEQLDATGDIWFNLAYDARELEEVRFKLELLEGLKTAPPKLKVLMRSIRASLELRPGVAAPALVTDRLDGKGQLKLADLRGKLVVLDFWATWCPPCVKSMKEELAPLQARYPERLAVVSVGVGLGDDTPEKQKALFAKLELSWTAVFAAGDGQAEFGVRSLPHLLLVDDAGKIVLTGATFKAVEQAVRERLGGGKGEPKGD